MSTGGFLPALAHVDRSLSWAAPATAPAEDVLMLTARNLSSVTVDPQRAGLTYGAALEVTSDEPLSDTLAGCGRTEQFGTWAIPCSGRRLACITPVIPCDPWTL